MRGISSKAMTTAEKRQAFLEDKSTIVLKNRTIEHLRELSFDIPFRSTKDTFDDLIFDMIKVYRKKKGLDWGSE